MFGKNRNNIKELKKQIDIFIVNKDILEEAYILLNDIKNITINTNNKLNVQTRTVNADTYECFNKKVNKKVVFNFTKNGDKNFDIMVKYPDSEVNIEVYNDNKNIIITKQRRINNTQVYVYVAKYIKNKLYSIDESINIDDNDSRLKKFINIRLNGNRGLKKVTIKYDNKAITEEFYKINFLNTNLSYNNAKDNNNKYEYSQKLWYQKELFDNYEESNKMVLKRK